MTEPPEAKPQIRSPTDAASLAMGEMSLLFKEALRVIPMDTKHDVLWTETIYVRSANTSLVRVAEILHPATRIDAVAIIIVRNHPSGDCSPSREDIVLAETIRKAGELAGIQVFDHLIIGEQRYVSIKERRLGSE